MKVYILLLILLVFNSVSLAVPYHPPTSPSSPLKSHQPLPVRNFSHEVIRHHGLSPHGFTGDRSFLHQALLRAVVENSIRVCVIGGSVPFGHGLKNGQREAWPAVTQMYLTYLLSPLTKHGMKVEVINLARPAQNSYVQLQTADDRFWTVLETCHVIIVDSTVNDSKHAVPQDEFESSSVLAEGGHMMRELLLRLIYPDSKSSKQGRESTSSNSTRGLLYFETFTNSPRVRTLVSPRDSRRRVLSSRHHHFIKINVTTTKDLKSRMLSHGSNTQVTRHKEQLPSRPPEISNEVKKLPVVGLWRNKLDQTHARTSHVYKPPSNPPGKVTTISPHERKPPSVIHSSHMYKPTITSEGKSQPVPCTCPLDVTQLRHWPALKAYQIPVLAWPNIVCRQEVGIDLYDVFPHPSELYHRYMGQVVGIALYELLLEALQATPPSLQLPLSETPAISHNATSSPSATKIVQTKEIFRPMLENIPLLHDRNDTSNEPSREEVEQLVRYEFRNSPFASSNCVREERLTFLTISKPESFVPHSYGSVWTFGEDVIGNDKLGWIAYNFTDPHAEKLRQVESKFQEESEIVFGFSSIRNILKVGVLKSFRSGMGELACCVDCEVFLPSHVIDTHWAKPNSVDCLVNIPYDLLMLHNTSNVAVAPPSQVKRERFLRCRASYGKKVKISSVVSC
mmetsp:Transcript_18945/g.31645  ORF Transcript_18945/g.31645 Transcript_18945/m.31645 type:complete len:679 (+) Transcript_18945:151-2187(+)